MSSSPEHVRELWPLLEVDPRSGPAPGVTMYFVCDPDKYELCSESPTECGRGESRRPGVPPTLRCC